jgi:hypothetical protein
MQLYVTLNNNINMFEFFFIFSFINKVMIYLILKTIININIYRIYSVNFSNYIKKNITKHE